MRTGPLLSDSTIFCHVAVTRGLPGALVLDLFIDVPRRRAGHLAKRALCSGVSIPQDTANLHPPARGRGILYCWDTRAAFSTKDKLLRGLGHKRVRERGERTTAAKAQCPSVRLRFRVPTYSPKCSRAWAGRSNAPSGSSNYYSIIEMAQARSTRPALSTRMTVHCHLSVQCQGAPRVRDSNVR